MALGDIVFLKGQGGLGRPLEGEDYVSAMLFYTANGNLPTGFSTSNRIKKLFSPSDAGSSGILKDYSDATAATYTSILTRGATGDTINIKVTEIPTLVNGVSTPTIVNLGTYTQTSTDTTLALLGASIAAFINANTYTHGYTASFATATLTIVMPKKLGIYVNAATPLTFTVTGTITAAAGTLGVTGVASKLAIWRYHIDEFFRLQPQGVLFVGFYPVPTSYTYAEITTIQNFADGKVRQIGIYLNGEAHAYTSGDLTAIQTEIVANCDANHKPLSAIYAADLSGTADLTTLTDLNTLTANKATAVVGQDGGALGAYLYKATGKSITTLGATLGAVAFSSVSDSIEWVSKFNISNGSECDTPAFANGDLVASKSQSYLTALDNLRYVFLLKYVGNSGTYHNNSHTAIISTSDYAYIENNRTIDKAIRGIYSSLLPALGSPLVLNADGTLTDETVAYFTGLAEINLLQMIRDVELSAEKVSIDPTQDVLDTNKVIVAAQLVPVGVARTIQVNIGFTPKIV